MRASGSCGYRHSVFRPFFGRVRSRRARSARVGGLDTRRLRQSRQKLLIRLAGIAAHDAPQSGVGLQGRRIDPDRLACDEIRRGQHWQDPREDRAVCLQVDQAARPRNRRVLGRHLVQAQAQEAAQRERIGRAPRNPSLRIDALEIPDEQQPEVGPWHHTRASHRRGIERRTLRFDEVVEAVRVEEVIQTLVKRVTARGGQLIVAIHNPGVRPRSLRRLMAMPKCSTRDRSCRSLEVL